MTKKINNHDLNLDPNSPVWQKIFQESKVPLWLEDISLVMAQLEEVRKSGITDFSAYLEGHPDFLFRVLSLVRIVDVNQAVIQQNGARDKDEMLQSFETLIVPESLLFLKEFLVALFNGARHHEGVSQYQDLNGRIYHTMVKFILLSGTGYEHLLLVETIDINELKNIQDALASSEKRYRTLVETSQDVLLVHDLDGRISFVNKAGLKLTGYTESGLVGRPISDVVMIDEENGQGRTKFRKTEKVLPYESNMKVKGGRNIPVEVSSSVISSGTGGQGPAQILMVVRDISDRKRNEVEERALEKRLGDFQKMESLGVLAGGIAHDFNNLLVTILGNAELLKVSGAQTPDSSESLDEIVEASSRAADLCRQMLTFAGRDAVVTSLTNLNNVISDISRLLEVSLGGKAGLGLELADDLPQVDIDAAKIRQVLVNMVSNAAESLGDEGGEVVVVTEVRDFARHELHGVVSLKPLEGGSYVQCQVRDSGCGMAPATIKNLFHPFYSTKESMRGLGMSTALGIVKSVGGGFWVESTVGIGSTVSFILPAVKQKGQVEPSQIFEGNLEGKNHRDLTGKTILLVDDDHRVRKTCGSLLRRLGCRVLVAGDGYEAVRIFGLRFEEIDGVLLDLVMSGMDGLGVSRRLRVISPHIPIFMSSGLGEEEVAERTAGLDIAAFVPKPYTLAQMGDILGAGLNQDS